MRERDEYVHDFISFVCMSGDSVRCVCKREEKKCVYVCAGERDMYLDDFIHLACLMLS